MASHWKLMLFLLAFFVSESAFLGDILGIVGQAHGKGKELSSIQNNLYEVWISDFGLVRTDRNASKNTYKDSQLTLKTILNQTEVV